MGNSGALISRAVVGVSSITLQYNITVLVPWSISSIGPMWLQVGETAQPTSPLIAHLVLKQLTHFSPAHHPLFCNFHHIHVF